MNPQPKQGLLYALFLIGTSVKNLLRYRSAGLDLSAAGLDDWALVACGLNIEVLRVVRAPGGVGGCCVPARVMEAPRMCRVRAGRKDPRDF